MCLVLYIYLCATLGAAFEYNTGNEFPYAGQAWCRCFGLATDTSVALFVRAVTYRAGSGHGQQILSHRLLCLDNVRKQGTIPVITPPPIASQLSIRGRRFDFPLTSLCDTCTARSALTRRWSSTFVLL